MSIKVNWGGNHISCVSRMLIPIISVVSLTSFWVPDGVAQIGLVNGQVATEPQAISAISPLVDGADEIEFKRFADFLPRIKPAKPEIAADSDLPQSALILSVPDSEALSLAAPTIAYPDFETVRAEIGENDFLTAEQEIRQEYGNIFGYEKFRKSIELATFYLAFDYYPEAWMILNANQPDPHISGHEMQMYTALKVMALYGLGRYRDIVEVAHEYEGHLGDGFTAMALSALARHEDAARFFRELENDLPAIPDKFHPEFILSLAYTGTATEKPEQVLVALQRLENYQLSDDMKAASSYIHAVATYQKTPQNAEILQQTYQSLEHIEFPWAGFATMEKVMLGVETDTLSVTEGRDELERLALTWHGGEFEYRLRYYQAQLARREGDNVAAFAALRDLVQNADDTKYSQNANIALQEMMVALVEPEQVIPLLEATRLFYDNIDLLAPGEEGDEQIRAVTQRLVSLDLLDEATELF